MPYPDQFRLMLTLASLVKPIMSRFPGRLRHVVALTPTAPNHKAGKLGQWQAATCEPRRGTVGLLPGCVQQVLGSEINAATARVLARLGFDVLILTDQPCCGALEHHLGQGQRTQARIKRNVSEWQRLVQRHDLEAIVVNASGCGTMLKDYAYLLRDDHEHADAAQLISAKAKDISEFIHERDRDGLAALKRSFPLPSWQGAMGKSPSIAYQGACSLQHGQ